MSQVRTNSLVPAGGIPAGASGGGIIQMVYAIKTDTQSFANSSSFNDVTGLSVTLTPRTSSNKVLIFFSISAGNGSDASHAHIRLVRGATNIGLGDAASNRITSTGQCINTNGPGMQIQDVMMILDSPATTSATTYKLQLNNNQTAGQTSFVNRSTRDNDQTGYDGRGSSMIIAMEVSG